MARERVISTLVVAAAAALAAWAIHADQVWFSTHWTRHQCFLTRTAQNLALVARIVAGVLSVALLFLRGPVSRVSGSMWLRIGLAVVLALVTTEIYLRSKQAKAAELEMHPPTDVHGYRVPSPATTIDLGAPSIVMSGESVAFGFGLAYEDTIGARLAQRTGLQDVNVAVNGFSNALTLQRLEDALPKLAKPVAVVCFVVHTWLDRNTDPRGWHVVWNDGRMMPLLPPEPPTSSPLLALGRSVFRYHDDHRLEIGRQLLSQTAEFIRSRNAAPIFVFTQCGARCRSTEFVVSELTRDLDAPWISLDTPEEENLPGDMHPGPKAAVRYTDAIESVLRANRVVP